MEFQTIKRNGNAVIPEAMFKLCGMGNTEKISMLKLNGGILLMPERVSTYQLLMLTDAMNMQSCEFLEAVAAECGTTEEPYAGKTLDEVLSEFQVAVPDWARESAGISESVKLECRSDENTGSITVYGKGSQLEYMEDDVFNKGVDGSLGVVFRGMREVVPFMKKTGGSIINYCSMYGIVSPDLRIYGDNPQKQPPNYGAGKAGVAQITRYAAGSLAQYGIRVNSITPGPFPNPRNQDDAAFNAQLANKTMLGRFGQSYEIAGAILLLASDASSFMTGSNVTVDGGWTAW